MKVVVFSDIHGKQELADRIIEFNPDADYTISLGDSELSSDYFLNHDVIFVKGNYPRDPGFAYDTEIKVDDLKVFITHGHKYKVHRGLDKLIKHGILGGFDILLYGHTHKLAKDKYGAMWIINPGSASSPRDHYPPSYCILQINGKDVEITYKEVLTNRTIEV